ncbi:4'-phosphopantetheinyl transferase family protein [Bryocella elongata]|nr:4'-phosphopantetheinyl transferase superfamily protein [Bryocella elongata]
MQRRRGEFALGREIAAQLLAELGSAETAVGVAEDRSPLWPAGFIGSITHTTTWCGVAVALRDEVRGIGIDIERMVSEKDSAAVSAVCLNAAERRLIASCADPLRAITICFAAKESLFKCLNPVTGTWFDFLEAEVTGLDMEGGNVALQLLRSLNAEFREGSVYAARCNVIDKHVFLSVELM